MAKKIILFLLFPFIFSCSEIPSAFLVLRGNYYSRQGRYQYAEVEYLQALDRGIQEPLIHYNQGNIYYSLGETESAQEAWKLAETLDHQELQFRLYFNRGVLYYDKGLYQQAYNEFKQALILSPSDIDCKINLELSLARIGGGGTPEDNIPQELESTQMDDTQRMLYYIENKEQSQWTSAGQQATRLPEDW